MWLGFGYLLFIIKCVWQGCQNCFTKSVSFNRPISTTKLLLWRNLPGPWNAVLWVTLGDCHLSTCKTSLVWWKWKWKPGSQCDHFGTWHFLTQWHIIFLSWQNVYEINIKLTEFRGKLAINIEKFFDWEMTIMSRVREYNKLGKLQKSHQAEKSCPRHSIIN